MKTITHHYRYLRISALRVAVLATAIYAFFLPSLPLTVAAESAPPIAAEYVYDVFVNEKYVGALNDASEAESLLREARLTLAAAGEELVLVEGEINIEAREVLPGTGGDSPGRVLTNMVNVLKSEARQTLERSYTVKISEFVVNLASKEEVAAMLQAAIDKYDEEQKFEVTLALDDERELSVLTAKIEPRGAASSAAAVGGLGTAAGIDHVTANIFAHAEPTREKDFADYDNGLIAIYFDDTVEVVEAYLAKDELMSLDQAIWEITKEEEKPQIYEVVSGDTLSAISLKIDVPIDRIVEMNDSLEDENSIIRIGEQLIIMVPEPELVVVRHEERYIEEYYNEDIIYVPNDEWYTTQTKTLQEPSAGVRNIAAITTFHNDRAVSREILKEEILHQAVPKIVERGTKIPPTYRKPLSGGRLSSGFGSRSAPVRGASTYHRGIDWATPTGTAIFASSGGVVSRAGWGSGYGYVVYIDHPDGRQTRYGHLSRILVRVGQAVSQGERIALSGNTGISSGPHIHFEILINGVQVNPLRYLN